MSFFMAIGWGIIFCGNNDNNYIDGTLLDKTRSTKQFGHSARQ